MRDVIREDILKCLDQKPADFEELLKLLLAGGKGSIFQTAGWKDSKGKGFE